MLQEPIYNCLDSLSPIRNTSQETLSPLAGYRKTLPFLQDSGSTVYLTDTPVSAIKQRDSLVTEVLDAQKIALPEIRMQNVQAPSHKYANAGIVIILVLFFLIATERILEGLTRAFWAAFNLKRQKEIDDDLTLSSSRNTAVVFLFPTALFAVCRTPESFLAALIASTVYLAIRYGIMALLDYVNYTTAFKFIWRMGNNYIIIASAIALLSIINNWIAVFCIIPALVFFIMESFVTLKNNFSVFFYILYICTLEMLPAAILIRLLL